TDSKKAIDKSLYYINQRQIVTGQAKGFKAKISQLESEKQSLINSCSDSIGAVKTDKAGYYVSKADGYEKSIKYNKVKDLTVKDLKKAKKSQVSSNVVGKVITNPVWYVVCQIDKDEAIKLSKMYGADEKVKVTLPFVSKESIESRIYSINQDSKNSGAVLVLACDYMNQDIAGIRHENVNISTLNYSGLKVSKRALHEDYVTKTVEKKNGETVEKRKKVQGVYVLYGSELVFKEISIVYSTNQYVLCNPTPEDGVLFNGKTVQLYDQVVIKGDNLYDGKVVA
ncbi:MAG: HlyD family efflux transporter periplasmic adaptor subunit, partial [Ruminococcus sp.]